MDIKVGDVIKFKEVITSTFNIGVSSGMLDYRGKFNVVSEVRKEGVFKVLGGMYIWDKEFIEKVYGNYKVGDVFHINNTRCTIENIGFNKKRNEVYFRRYPNGIKWYMSEISEFKEMDNDVDVLDMSKETKPEDCPLKYWELEEGKLYHEGSEEYLTFRIRDGMLEFKAKDGTNSFIVDNVNHLRLAAYNFKEIPQEIKSFPKIGDVYYSISTWNVFFDTHYVDDFIFKNDEYDNRMIEVGNFFKTREAAQSAIDKIMEISEENKRSLNI